MPILHMETHGVRGVGNQLQQTSHLILQHTQQLSTTVQNLSNNWQGPSADIFISYIHSILQQLNQLSSTGDYLNKRLQHEVTEWEQVASNLGASGTVLIPSTNPLRQTSVYSPATAELISAILEDEEERRSFTDDLGDIEAWFIDKYEGNLESIERFLLEKTTGQSIERISLGRAQMNPEAVIEMVDKGYLPKPTGWENDKLDIALRWLLDDSKAEELVSGRINHIVDHWANKGVNISNRPEIIGTLYSIGLESKQGVHLDPQPNERGQSIADRVKEIKTNL